MQELIQKPDHVTQEMAQLILEVTNAQKKDEQIIAKWKQNQLEQKAVWEALSPQEQQFKISEGTGFVFLDKPPMSAYKWTRAIRRQIRYRIFRIRDGNLNYDKGLKAWLKLQLDQTMTPFHEFTFLWDVSAIEPLKVVEPMEWDGDLVIDKLDKKKYCDPPAFTKQEK